MNTYEIYRFGEIDCIITFSSGDVELQEFRLKVMYPKNSGYVWSKS